MTDQHINMPEALMGQALGIMQRLRNVGASPLGGPGVPPTVPYEWPTATTIKYIFGDQTLTLDGVHLADLGRVNWSDERSTSMRLVDEIEVPDGVPFTRSYSKTSSETTTLEEATKIGLQTALRAGLGQEYGTGVSVSQKVESDYEKRFGHKDEEAQSETFTIGPVTEAGKYRVWSYGFSRAVSSRPEFDYVIRWEKRDKSDDGSIEWWQRVEFASKSDYLDFIAGKAADNVGVFHKGRVVSGPYGSTYEAPPVALAPIYRQSRQVPEIGSPVQPIQETVQYGQGTRIERE